jgi:hypothetical protein
MNLLRFLFGCSHRNLSVPYTMPTRNGKSKQTYKVCMDCTAHVPYSLKTFTTVRKRPVRKAYELAYANYLRTRRAEKLMERADELQREMEIARQ